MGLLLLGVVTVLCAGIGYAVWRLERDQEPFDYRDAAADLVSELETWLKNRRDP